jgi:hypothetical protein
VVFSEDADESYVRFLGRQYELLLWRAVWDERETVSFSLDTNGNLIYNFKEEYEKGTILGSYTQDSQCMRIETNIILNGNITHVIFTPVDETVFW